jgi:hypothetical protein
VGVLAWRIAPLSSSPSMTVSHYGRSILLNGKSGTGFFELAGKDLNLRAVVAYRQRHWSVDLVPDFEHRRLFKLSPKGRVELWQIHRPRLDHSRFQGLA